MQIKDKKRRLLVDVFERDCLKKVCYWPRPDPGVFTQGVGYRQRSANAGWICGTRELHGCPSQNSKPHFGSPS